MSLGAELLNLCGIRYRSLIVPLRRIFQGSEGHGFPAKCCPPFHNAKAAGSVCTGSAATGFAGHRWSYSYSITLSARTSTDSGILMSSALAVAPLITSSNLVGCSTGKSAGSAPFNILSTNVAALRNNTERSTP